MAHSRLQKSWWGMVIWPKLDQSSYFPRDLTLSQVEGWNKPIPPFSSQTPRQVFEWGSGVNGRSQGTSGRCRKVRRDGRDTNKTHLSHQPSDHFGTQYCYREPGIASIECAKLCYLGRQGSWGICWSTGDDYWLRAAPWLININFLWIEKTKRSEIILE